MNYSEKKIVDSEYRGNFTNYFTFDAPGQTIVKTILDYMILLLNTRGFQALHLDIFCCMNIKHRVSARHKPRLYIGTFCDFFCP